MTLAPSVLVAALWNTGGMFSGTLLVTDAPPVGGIRPAASLPAVSCTALLVVALLDVGAL